MERHQPLHTPPTLPAAPSALETLRRYFWLLLLLPLLGWAWQATEVDLPRLINDAPKARQILTDLFNPSLMVPVSTEQVVTTRLEIPCLSGTGPTLPATDGAQLTLSSACLNGRDPLTVTGSGFAPNVEGRLYWQPPESAGRLRDARFSTDAQGNFTVETDVPPLLEEQDGEAGLLAIATLPSGGMEASEALKTTARAITETIFLALMATTLGAFLAIPLSFFGARNLMPRTPLGNALYGLTRTLFNTTRAIEPLILATIFAIWVGFGPFAGVLALSISTIANIGKLYAESAETIDAGPLEAIRSVGGNQLQVIFYGVIPQIVPPYLSFTIYYWDINVRMSTIIGFVGGGGIGLELSRWINQLQWTNAATGVWAIILVVMIMDYVSAVVRERLT